MRYHYVGPIFIAILLCLLLGAICGQRFSGRWTADALLVIWMASTLAFHAWSGWTIEHFANDRQMMEDTVRAMDAVIGQTPGTGPVYLPNRHGRLAHLTGPSFVGDAAIYAIYLRSVRDRPVFFVEPSQAVLDLTSPGGRLASLLSKQP